MSKNDTHMIEENISNTLENNYMPYAMSVIVSRAIPEIDGLKPSHRKILYTMYKMGLLSGSRTKSSNIVGQTMKLNPHGDSAIYETMVRLTTGNNSLSMPIIASKGNFGKSYSRDMAYAAPRYTEVMLDKVAEEFFKNIDKDAVDFVDNYDNTTKEPTLLPVSFPNILVNPNQGIAVGMASNFPSFNLKEICEATIDLLESNNTPLVDIIKGPDFSTGGKLLYDKTALETMYTSGKGTVKVRAKYSFNKKTTSIEITEIPYTTTIEAIIDKVIDLVKGGKIKDITDVRDDTGLSGLKITLDVKKSCDVEKLMAYLFRYTPLEDSFSANMNILIDGQPKVCGINEILKEWIKFRINSIKRITQWDINKLESKLHLLIGLRNILDDIDNVIALIRNSDTDSIALTALKDTYSLDDLQAEYILNFKIRNLNKEYISKKILEIESIEEQLGKLNLLYNSNARLKTYIKKELKGVIKSYGSDRRTDIIHIDDIKTVSNEDMIADYNTKLFLTNHGYIKKIQLVSLRSNPSQKLKDGDDIYIELDSSNKIDLLFFTNKCNVYKLKGYDIPDHKASSLGEYANNLLGMDSDECVIDIVQTKDFSEEIIFCYSNGKCSKVSLKQYDTVTKRKKIMNAYSNKSDMISIIQTPGRYDLITKENKALNFDTVDIKLSPSKSTQGMSVIIPFKKDYVEQVIFVNKINPYNTTELPSHGFYLKTKKRKQSFIKK